MYPTSEIQEARESFACSLHRERMKFNEEVDHESLRNCFVVDASEYDRRHYPFGRGASAYFAGKGAGMFAVAGHEFHATTR